ncbi:MAG: MoaD/ThiS family protein [Anaerolineae bacterium]
MMEIDVRLFASAREIAGTNATRIMLTEPATVKDLETALFERHPGLEALRLRIAINARYAPAGAQVHPDDEVAVIPPVGGG